MTKIHQNFLDKKASLELILGESITIDGLVGPLRIFQRKKGHRHSIDDATTAWYALQKRPNASKILDLGTGVGTVGMAVLWGLGEAASLTCVEAQKISYLLLQANLECNELSSRAHSIHADIRQLNLKQKFELITGSPPYFPAEAGILPADEQKAYARFELRGDVGDYARVAKRHLSEKGIFVFCFPFQQKKRCIDLVRDEGFSITTIRDVIPRPGREALFSLYSASLQLDLPITEEAPLLVAGVDGIYTDEMHALQRTRGFGPLGTNVVE